MKFSVIIVADSGPLITLAVDHALDALLLPKLPVIVPDMVRFELVQDSYKPGAREAADWIRVNEPQGVRVASTEVFEEFEVLRQVNAETKTKGRGERAAAEVLSNELNEKGFGAILLCEDGNVRNQNFLTALPDQVEPMSASEFLFEIEQHGLLRG